LLNKKTLSPCPEERVHFFLYPPSAGIIRIRFNGYHLRQILFSATPNLHFYVAIQNGIVNDSRFCAKS